MTRRTAAMWSRLPGHRAGGGRGLLRRAIATRRGQIGLGMVVIVVGIAVIGPLAAPYSSTAFTTTPFGGPSAHHLLGGDELGRDVLSRVLDGGRALLLMAALATVFGVALGTLAGVAAAYLRGFADTVIMRTVDLVLAFPQLVLALLVVSIAGPKLWLIVVTVGFTHVPQVARVVRGATLAVAERDFVQWAELQGMPRRRIMARQILPMLTGSLAVEVGVRLTFSIMIMAGLAFLGFAQPPPTPNWGLMINENRVGIAANAWPVIVPVALITVLTIGMNTFTDAVSRVSIGMDGGLEEVPTDRLMDVQELAA